MIQKCATFRLQLYSHAVYTAYSDQREQSLKLRQRGWRYCSH